MTHDSAIYAWVFVDEIQLHTTMSWALIDAPLIPAIMPCLEPPKKIQKFKNSTVEKKNISLVQLTNAAISLLNW